MSRKAKHSVTRDRAVNAIATTAGLDPETRLAGVLLADSIDACRSGDAMACEWLRARAPTYLILLAGENAPQFEQLIGPMTANVQLSYFDVFGRT